MITNFSDKKTQAGVGVLDTTTGNVTHITSGVPHPQSWKYSGGVAVGTTIYFVPYLAEASVTVGSR